LSLHTYLRYAHDFQTAIPGDLKGKIYNLYLNWKEVAHSVDLRLGRQYLAAGVGKGTMDGLKISFRRGKRFSFLGYLGTQVPLRKSTQVNSWSESKMWGAYFWTNYPWETEVGISFVRKERQRDSYLSPYSEKGIAPDPLVEQLLGILLRRKFGRRIETYGRMDFDALFWDFGLRWAQIGTRYRAHNRLFLFFEFDRRRPSVRRGSVFSVFRQKANSEFRLGADYAVNQHMSLVGEYALVLFSHDNGHRIRIGTNLGSTSIGYVGRLGYSGDSHGAYGNVSYLINDKLSVSAGVDYSRYEYEEEVSGRFDALGAMARIVYQPVKNITLSLEGQNLRNRLYSHDTRLLARIDVRFFRRLTKGTE
ncbi:MAG: hypothetical protein ACE5OR_06130, partial [bacterium]